MRLSDRLYKTASVRADGAARLMDVIDSRIKAYRFVGYAAVGFSVVALLSVCVTLPIVYNYVHYVKASLHKEASLCKVSRLLA